MKVFIAYPLVPGFWSWIGGMLMVFVLVIVIFIALVGCMYSFFKHEVKSSSIFSVDLFLSLLFLYISVMLAFGLVYFILSIEGIVLAEGGDLIDSSLAGSMLHSIYFSGVTLLTVGYGDIIPVGIGRFLALIEALIGYLLPSGLVLKVWQYTVVRQKMNGDGE